MLTLLPFPEPWEPIAYATAACQPRYGVPPMDPSRVPHDRTNRLEET